MSGAWLTFDLDGTLLADPFGRVVLPLIDAHFAAALPARRARDVIAQRQRALDASDRLAVFDWDALVRWLAAETGIPWSHDLAALVEATLAALPARARSRLVFRDVVPALLALRAAGWRIAAVTNGYARYQAPILRQLGLSGLFDAVVAPDLAGCAKPDPRMLDSLGGRSQVRAHIGDLLSQDLCMARQAGVEGVWIRRGPGRPGIAVSQAALRRRLAAEGRQIPHNLAPADVWPDAVIAHLAGLAALLGAAEGG